MTPTARTLAALRDKGMTCQVVERYNRFAKVRQDLFGFIDIVAISAAGIIAVQATANSGGHHAARVAKAKASPHLRTWLEAGGRFEVWSWAMQGPRGKAKRWTARVEEITLAALAVTAEAGKLSAV